MKNILLLILIVLFVNVNAQIEPVVQFKNESLIQFNEDLNYTVRNDKINLQGADDKPEKKSLGKAFFYSLLLPGLGESYVGNTTYTKIFMSLEVIGWGFLIGNYMHVSWLENDYKNFAYQHANINKYFKENQYWIDIGKYDNIYEYNEQRRRDRDIFNIYKENENYYWQWDSHANRLDYDSRRIRARLLERDDIYYMGAIVLNHIVSAINALRLAKAYNNKLEESGWEMGVKYNRYQNSVSLSFIQHF